MKPTPPQPSNPNVLRGSRPSGPANTTRIADLFRRFRELAPQHVAGTPDPSAWLPHAEPTDGPLSRALEHLQGSFLRSQGLKGRVHVARQIPRLDVPETPLRSLLEHLVDGGLRDNPSPEPYCHIGVGPSTGDLVTLVVRDNGVGVPESTPDEIRAFIAKRGVKDIPERVYRLFLADNLVRWLGGSLRVAPSRDGEGATVVVELPSSTREGGPEDRLVARHVF